MASDATGQYRQLTSLRGGYFLSLELRVGAYDISALPREVPGEALFSRTFDVWIFLPAMISFFALIFKNFNSYCRDRAPLRPRRYFRRCAHIAGMRERLGFA